MIAALLFIAILDIGPLVGIGANANAILTLLAALIFVVVHGYIALGWRNIIAFSLITVVISFISEVIGVATGLIFGSYYYTDLLGPKLLGVPPMIQIGYLATGYASVMMGRIILSLLRPVTGQTVLAASLAGAVIMVSWDVAMDPYQSTVMGDWIWRDGGGYFGVPLHNYAGWFGTVFMFTLIYFIFASRYAEQPRETLRPLPQSNPSVKPLPFWEADSMERLRFFRGSIDRSEDQSSGACPVGRQANANSFTPANANLYDADIDRVGGSRLNGKGTRSTVLHGADFGSHSFQPGRDRDEKRFGAEYRHV
jgi:hypothetical protein